MIFKLSKTATNFYRNFLFAVCAVFFVNVGWGQNATARIWNITTIGTLGSPSAIKTPGNWSGGLPAAAEVGQFASVTGTLFMGVNCNPSFSFGAIEFTSNWSGNLVFGNSSATSGIFTFNGVTVNSIQNVILRNNSSSTITLQPSTSASGLMGIGLGNATNNIINIDGTGGITVSSVISGTSRNLTKGGSGAGVLTLSGANIYTGTTTISAGKLIVGAAAPSGSAGALGNASSTITLGDANTNTNNSSPSLLTGGAFTVARTVTIANQATSGTYTLGGNNASTSTFSGAITINQPLTISQVVSGTLNIQGGITTGNAGSKNLTFNNAGSVAVSNTAITPGTGGDIAVIQSGAGTTTFSAANTYSGNTTISAGTLALSGSGSIASSPQIIIASGGTFDVTGLTSALTLAASQSVSSTATGANTTATITVSSTKGLTFNGTPGSIVFTAYGGANGSSSTNAPLTITGASAGALALAGAPVTVTTTSALGVGIYKLIAKGGSATGVSGTPGALTMAGSGLASNTSGSLSVSSGGELILTVVSTDANLSALSLSSGTLSPVFASGTITYTASVSNTTSSITVTPTRNQANATIEVRVNAGSYSAVTSGSASGALSLNVGDNTVDVKVTAQDGSTTKTYSITVTRATALSPTLSAGTISGSFGNICINTTSSAQSFTLSGSNLNGTDVTVSSTSSRYTFATSSGGSYSNPLTLTSYYGSSPGTIYVKYAPTATGTDNANISIAGGGASAATVSQSSNSGVNTVPTVTTPTTASLSSTTVTLGGTISSIGCSNATTTGIYYSTSSGFADGAGTAVSTGSLNISSTPNVFTQAVTGLTANTQYYFKPFATNSGGNGYSSQGSFITFPTAPAGLSTGSITNAGFTVSWTDLAGTLEFYEVQIFIDAGFNTQVGSTYTTAANASSQAISGLSASTNYYYRVRAVNNTNQASSYSTGGPVTTSAGPCGTEDFTNNNASSSYSSSSFTGNNSVVWSYIESRDEFTYGINGKGIMLRGLSSTYASKLTSSSVSGGLGSFTCSLKKAYTGSGNRQVELFVNNISQGSCTAWDNTSIQTFTINNINITGNVIVELRALTDKQFVIDDISWTCYSAPEINIKQSSTNLTSGSGSYSFGNVTLGGSSSAVTFTVENIGTETLNLTGTPKVAISGHTGDFAINQTSTSATVAASGSTTFTVTFSPTTTGARSATISIANDDSNENPYTFTVAGTGATYAPSVTTSAATSISTTGGTLNGEVTSDGGATVTERGFVYKTSSSVTISDNKTVVAGTTGTFSLSLSSLSASTQYYFRAYAINPVNTTLGDELNFWTLANTPSAPTVNTPTSSSLNVSIGGSDGNSATTAYAIQETMSGNYVQANGSLGVSAVWQTASTWSAITVIGLSSATTYTFKVKARNGANVETTSFSATTSGTTSSIGLNAVILSSALTSIYGSVSSGVSFTASGTNLTSNITATAQSGYQVSTDDLTYGSSVSVASGTTVYVRLTSTVLVGNYNNQAAVVLSGGGASSSANVTTSLAGNTVSQKALTVTGLTAQNKTYDGLTTATATGTVALSGVIGADDVSLTGTPTFTFVNATVGTSKTVNTTGYSLTGAQSANYSLTQPSFTANITVRTLTITANSVSKVQGVLLSGGAGSTAFSSSGLQNSETIGSVTIAYGTAGATTGDGNTAGVYASQVTPSAATAGTFTASNYSISYVAGSITVTQAPCLSENFSSASSGNTTTTNGQSTPWTGGANFTGTLTNVYEAGGAVKLGVSAGTGSMTSASLSGVSGDVTVSFDVKGWTTVEGNINVTLNGSTQTITYTAVMSGSFETKSAQFTSVPANSTLTFATTAKRAFIDNVVLTCSPVPEINLQGNSTSIASGDATPATADHTDFGSAAVTGGTVVRTFTIQNTGTAALNLTGSSPYVAISGTNAADFSITATPSSSIAASASTTFQVTFDPSAVGTRTATLTIANDDSDEGTYTFAIQGTGVNSNTSDIIVDAGFTYSSNINYAAYQSATISTTANGVAAMGITIRDGGGSSDADALGTELNSISFTAANIANIRSAALFQGSTLINNAPSIGSGNISFTGLSGSNVTANDNGSKTLTLYVTFLATVTDNQQLQFTVNSATSNITGSSFAAANAGAAISSITSDRNRIVVVATKLIFVQQPSSSTSVNATMSASPSVAAVDALNNRDLDYTSTISLSSSGTMTGSPISVSATSGLSTFSVTHTVAGTGLFLSATSGSLTATGNSNAFSITTFTYASGDFRPLYATDLSYNGGWEYFNGSSWVAVPDGNAPQNTSTAVSRIIISYYVTGGSSSTKLYNADIIILSGGELQIIDDNSSPTQFIGDSKKIEVLSGGTLTIEGDINIPANGYLIVRDGGLMVINQPPMVNNHAMWSGTELFEGGSTVKITSWNFGESSTTASLNNISTSLTLNANGWKFGNLILDVNTGTYNWQMVGGGIGIVNLCENDFSVTNASSTGYITGATNQSGTNGFVINGNMVIYDGNFAFGSSYSNNAFNHQFTINGNFDCLSNDALKIHLNGANTPTTLSGNVTFKGNVNIASSVTSFTNDGGSSSPARMSVNFSGGTLATPNTVSIAPTAVAIPMNVKANAFVLLKGQDLTLNSVASYTAAFIVESSAYLHFGWNTAGTTPLVIKKTTSSAAGTNTFASQSNSTLVITSSDGIQQASSTLGNVQMVTSNKSFDQTATFWYVGKANQVTGDGLSTGSTGKVVFVNLLDNTLTLSLSNSIGISNATTIDASGGKLEIQKGIVIGTTSADFTGSGRLVMSDGEYRISTITGTPLTNYLPQLSGYSNYSLTGGTVHLNGNNAIQILSGTPTYYKLAFSGTNALGGYKGFSNAVVVTNNVTISGTPVVDAENNSFSGDAGLTMSGGRLRMAKLNETLPQLSGVNNPYVLTGGTIELYGSSAAETHSIRGTYNSSNVSYFNVELNATGANVTNKNIGASASFAVTGTLNVNSPAVFQLDENDVVSGSGTFNVNAGSTLKYGNANGITSSGATGNVRTTTRSFLSTASYGFVGTTAQNSGNGLPATIENLYVQRVTSSAITTLTNSLKVNSTLKMIQGHLNTSSNTLELGNSTTQLGTLDYTTGYVLGKMKRWFNSTNSGNASGLFPMGLDVSGIKNRFAKVEYTSAASAGGHLTVQFVSTAMGLAGLPIISTNTGGFGFNVTSTENQGYWQIDNESGKLTDGAYTISLTGEGVTTVNSLAGITLLKRVGAGNWTAPGTHVAASGSTAVPTVSRSGVSGWSNFGFGGNSANPLPVELIDFSAFCDDKISHVTWSTASEKNSDYFEVEVSTDLVSWSEVSQTSAAGNSSNKRDYTIADNLTRGLRYYRLVQIDFDGKQRIYDPISLNCGGSESVFMIYPNPTSGDFVVSIQNKKLSGENAETLNTEIGIAHD